MKRSHILWVKKKMGPFYKLDDYNFKRINFKGPFYKLDDYKFKRINFKHKNIGGISIPPY